MGKRRRKRESETLVTSVYDGAMADGGAPRDDSPGAIGSESPSPADAPRDGDEAPAPSEHATAEEDHATAEEDHAAAEEEPAAAIDPTASAFDDPTPVEAVRRAAEAVWVASQKGPPWATLAVVPAEPGLRTDALARAVAEVGTEQRGEPVDFIDLRDVTLANSRSLVETLALAAAFRHVVALGCPTDNRAAELLATSAAAAVLIVAREETRLAAARRVLDAVGPERFLGAVVLEPER